MPGRQFSAGDYRYGFNGKEKDKDINSLTAYDYGFRIYNPAIGRFLSVDPLMSAYCWNSPYAYAENDVIRSIDIDGLEKYYYWRFKDKEGNTVLALDRVEDLVDKTYSYSIENFDGFPVRVPTGVKSTAINQRQEYVVMQEDDFSWQNSYGEYKIDEYNEQRTFGTYERALQSTDKDFEHTIADNWHAFLAALDQTCEGIQRKNEYSIIGAIEEGTTVAFGGGGGGKRKKRTSTKSIKKPHGPESPDAPITFNPYQKHHIIFARAANVCAFVKKAVRAGWNINSLKNLTPIERYLKKNGMGRHARHMKYSSQILNHLNGLDLSKFTGQQAGAYLDELSDYILDKIRKNPKVKLNDLDLQLDKFKPKK